ncbi:MAG: hypothetical protein WA705_00705 [Candidatus Ozemobacteraceae bacterium]
MYLWEPRQRYRLDVSATAPLIAESTGSSDSSGSSAEATLPTSSSNVVLSGLIARYLEIVGPAPEVTTLPESARQALGALATQMQSELQTLGENVPLSSLESYLAESPLAKSPACASVQKTLLEQIQFHRLHTQP